MVAPFTVLVLSVDISTPTRPIADSWPGRHDVAHASAACGGGGVTSRRYARRLPHGFRRQGRPGEGPIRHTRPISIMRTLRPPDTPPRSAQHRGKPSTCSLSRRSDTAELFANSAVEVDAVAFETAARAALAARDTAGARRALDGYGGELLPQDPYADWAAPRREQLRQLHLELLRLDERWQDLADLDTGDERAHLELMRRYIAAGDRHAALRQFERLDRVLPRELGVAPSSQAVALRDRALADTAVSAFPPVERTLIGRDAELAALEGGLDAAAAGRSRTILVSGPPGIGKTALLAEARAAATRRGWRTGFGTSAPVEGAWPYAPVVEALADLCRRHAALLDGLADTYRVEIDRALAGADSGWAGESGHQRLFVAAAELLRLAAATHGVLLVVDDIHDADDASLRLLHYLARASVDQRVVIALGHRPQPHVEALADTRHSLVFRHLAIDLLLASSMQAGTRAL